jgi:hypothetical protein
MQVLYFSEDLVDVEVILHAREPMIDVNLSIACGELI